eukprot:2345690-Amphidinium_carterae.1
MPNDWNVTLHALKERAKGDAKKDRASYERVCADEFRHKLQVTVFVEALLQAAETSEHFRYPPGTQLRHRSSNMIDTKNRPTCLESREANGNCKVIIRNEAALSKVSCCALLGAAVDAF